jgi:hypothetical protein
MIEILPESREAVIGRRLAAMAENAWTVEGSGGKPIAPRRRFALTRPPSEQGLSAQQTDPPRILCFVGRGRLAFRLTAAAALT